MPSHWGNPRLNIVPGSSATGMQYPQAVGMAEASLYYEKFPQCAGTGAKGAARRTCAPPSRRNRVRFRRRRFDERRGIFRSAERSESAKLPVLFLIEDNGWAISVPVEVQTAGGSISKLVANFPGLHVEECDGSDPLASYAALSAPWHIAGRARARRWCTRTSRVPIRIRFPTTKNFTRQPKCASAKRSAIRCRSSGCSWCAKGFSMRSEMEATRSGS